jgi:hypothetical protein
MFRAGYFLSRAEGIESDIHVNRVKRLAVLCKPRFHGKRGRDYTLLYYAIIIEETYRSRCEGRQAPIAVRDYGNLARRLLAYSGRSVSFLFQKV